MAKNQKNFTLSYKAKIAGNAQGRFEEKSVFIPVATSVLRARKLNKFLHLL